MNIKVTLKVKKDDTQKVVNRRLCAYLNNVFGRRKIYVSESEFRENPIKFLKTAPNFRVFTNATDEQMEQIKKTSLKELLNLVQKSNKKSEKDEGKK